LGKAPEAAITNVGGLTLKILTVLVKLDRQNNDRLDRLSKQFTDKD